VPSADRELRELGSAALRLERAEAAADEERTRRDALVLSLARQNVPYAQIAVAARMTVQGVGKITRAAGIRRYRGRAERGSPVSQ